MGNVGHRTLSQVKIHFSHFEFSNIKWGPTCTHAQVSKQQCMPFSALNALWWYVLVCIVQAKIMGSCITVMVSVVLYVFTKLQLFIDSNLLVWKCGQNFVGFYSFTWLESDITFCATVITAIHCMDTWEILQENPKEAQLLLTKHELSYFLTHCIYFCMTNVIKFLVYSTAVTKRKCAILCR